MVLRGASWTGAVSATVIEGQGMTAAEKFLEEKIRWHNEENEQMGEAKRCAEAAKDLGQVMFECPDISVWGTPEGLAEATGRPASDPKFIATSEMLHAVWVAANGKQCEVILGAVIGLLSTVFNTMADGHRGLRLDLARKFAGDLVCCMDESKEVSDDELADVIARRRAQARPKQ
jgi:hypothetical protein